MSRSVEDVLKEILGSQTLTIARMQAQIESLTEQLTKPKEKATE